MSGKDQFVKFLCLIVVFLFTGVAGASSLFPSYQIISQSYPLSTGTTLYVGGGGLENYTRIQDAIDNASDGDTVFVFDDSSPYYEHVVVDKSITLIGENKNTTIIDGGGRERVILVSANWVTIGGFTLQNSGIWEYDAGIIVRSDYNMITGNYITGNNKGIGLIESSSNTILGNNISANNGLGISLSHSTDNTFTGNIISSNNGSYGIYLLDSNNSIITENTLVNDGLFVYDTYHNTINHNTVNGNPLVYLEGETDTKITDAGQVVLVNCERIIVENVNITTTDVGIELWDSNDCVIRDSNISNNGLGIRFYHSSDNTIMRNMIRSNNGDGISIYEFSNTGNIISENVIIDNKQIGIHGRSGSSSTIKNNTISDNGGNGILFLGASNTIVGNTIVNNADGGIAISAYGNTVSSNTISKNKYGISLSGSGNTVSGNTIYLSAGSGITVSHVQFNTLIDNNITGNNGTGIRLSGSKFNTIRGNFISNNTGGIRLTFYKLHTGGFHFRKVPSMFNSIKSNTLSDNDDGIYLTLSLINFIHKNNFLKNEQDAFFTNSFLNRWRQNYWNQSGILLKRISGEITIESIEIPWFNIDWRPALRPYSSSSIVS